MTVKYDILVSQLKQKIKELDDELQRSKNAFLNIIGKNRDGILIFDLSGKVMYANPAALTLFGKDLGELLGENIGIFIEDNNKTEITIMNKERGPIFVEVNIGNTMWNNQPAKLASLRDITEHKKTNRILRRLSHYDYLTNLSNRVYFEESLKVALHNSSIRHKKLALFFLDMDGFKQVNDTYGHQVGDLLLVNVANLLKSCVREEDIVSRLGGDEFAIVIDRSSDRDYYVNVATRILNKIKKPILINGYTIRVNFSIGIAVFPDHAETVDDLIKRADMAMYSCKSLGAGRYCFAE